MRANCLLFKEQQWEVAYHKEKTHIYMCMMYSSICNSEYDTPENDCMCVFLWETEL